MCNLVIWNDRDRKDLSINQIAILQIDRTLLYPVPRFLLNSRCLKDDKLSRKIIVVVQGVQLEFIPGTGHWGKVLLDGDTENNLFIPGKDELPNMTRFAKFPVIQ